MKRGKYLLVIIGTVLVSAGIIASGIASDKPEISGLKDYIRIEKELHKNKNQINQTSDLDNLKISDFSIPIYYFSEGVDIRSYEGSGLGDILEGSKERLWFMMDGRDASGILIADDKETIKMGGDGKDLMKLYVTLEKEYEKGSDIRYIEFRGRGLFLVVHNHTEDVWLSPDLADSFKLQPYEKISSNDVLQGMKEQIELFSDGWFERK
ncbi:hypothetical protein NDK47_22395 [Brevibacillus ruminantium]|uniref:DUF4825 domain-containing protein n=1 Tax=Brevibacillus ruminantium TaxID=2950604 RepID=A0ABY4WDL4_9BACL|nr:hypothetical protein [Brevibacillus ruminantium]USG64844.1 hypothetical protein NDK47_22395 [Brevibacillus ruminantium]